MKVLTKLNNKSINKIKNNKCMYNKSLCMRTYSQFVNVNRRSHLTEIKIDRFNLWNEPNTKFK